MRKHKVPTPCHSNASQRCKRTNVLQDPGPILKHPSGPGIPNEQKKQVFPKMRTYQGASNMPNSQKCKDTKLPQRCEPDNFSKISVPRLPKTCNIGFRKMQAYQGFPKMQTHLPRCPKGANLPSTSKHTIEMQSHVPRIPEHANTSTCPKGVHILSFSKMQQSLYVPKMQTYQSSPKMQTHQSFRGCNCS